LKYSLKSNISSKPFYHYTGSHLGQILHCRLRMQCTSLNQHLYRKNIVDSPNCICGSTQSTTHYLFHYLRYTAQRQMYINSINVPINLTTEILLLGSPKLALNQNVELFLAVQKFIICSKRFTSLSPLSSSIYLQIFTFISIQNNIVFYNLKFEIV
jgi:hypothetical protein